MCDWEGTVTIVWGGTRLGVSKLGSEYLSCAGFPTSGPIVMLSGMGGQ